MTWRWTAATIATDSAIAVFAKVTGYGNSITDLFSAVAGLALSIWALRSALRCKFKLFAVLIEDRNPIDCA
jgi:hypothetical protein